MHLLFIQAKNKSVIRHTVMVWNITLHFFLANPIATVLIFQSYCFMNTALRGGLFVLVRGQARIRAAHSAVRGTRPQAGVSEANRRRRLLGRRREDPSFSAIDQKS